MTETVTTGQQCAFCQQPLKAGVETVKCGLCGTVQHWDCWQHNGQCVTQGCNGIPQGVAVQEVVPPVRVADTPKAADTLDGAPTGWLPANPHPSSYPPPPPPMRMAQPGMPPPPAGKQGLILYEVGLGAALSNGWAIFSRYMGISIVVMLLWGVIAVFGSIIPILNILFAYLVNPAFMGGLVIFGLKMVNDQNPEVGDLFSGFQQFGRWLGAYWLLMVAYLACSLPLIIFFLMTSSSRVGSYSPGEFPAQMIPLMFFWLVTMVVACVVMTRWIFVYFLVAEGYGVIDAFKQSAAMTEGRRLLLFGIAFVLYLIAVLGVLACFVGVLFTAPLALCAFTYIYNAVKVDSQSTGYRGY
ncbi:MAG: RING finger protein [Armatimonadota bacterium]